MRARFVAGAGLIGLIAALCLAPAASADTATIGAAASPGTIFGGAANFAVIQRTTDAASPSFAVPQVPAGGGPWSVTSWGALGRCGQRLGLARDLASDRHTGGIAADRDRAAAGLPDGCPDDPLGEHPGSARGPSRRPQWLRTRISARATAVAQVGDEAIWPNGSTTPAVGQTIGAPSSDFYPNGGTSGDRANVQATVTSTPAGAATTPTTPTTPTKKKCKKKKHKRSAASAKKKCKKHKKK